MPWIVTQRFCFVFAVVLAGSLLIQKLAVAQGTSTSTPESSNFIEDAKKYSMTILPSKKSLQLRENSLFNWTNPTRQQEKGGIYVWTLGERPHVIGSIFTYEYNSKVFRKHEFHSLSPGPVQATLENTLAWAPLERGVTWHDLEGADRPGKTHVARSLQMRQIARSFRAELVDPKSQKFELRLAPRPLFEYAAPEEGILDGVILSYVVATDPEVLLLVEAYDEQRGGKNVQGFRYAFARFHYWYVAAYRDDNKVWEAQQDLSVESGRLGNPIGLNKVYTSFHPER